MGPAPERNADHRSDDRLRQLATLNGSGSDSLAGAIADTTAWTISSLTTDTGTVSGTTAGVAATEIAFSGMSTLVAGKGNPGDNSISVPAPATWTLTGNETATVGATGGTSTLTLVGFDVISASATDKLTGPVVAAMWSTCTGPTTLGLSTAACWTPTTVPGGDATSGYTGDSFNITGVVSANVTATSSQATATYQASPDGSDTVTILSAGSGMMEVDGTAGDAQVFRSGDARG